MQYSKHCTVKDTATPVQSVVVGASWNKYAVTAIYTQKLR